MTAATHASYWTWQEHGARLSVACCDAVIACDAPGEGLGEVRVDRAPLPGARLLGFAMTPSPAPPGPVRVAAHLRASDFVAAYEETPGWPFRVDALWRAGELRAGAARAGCVELVLSLCTSLLDARPRLSAQSDLPGAEALRWSGAGFEPVSAPWRSGAMGEAPDAPRCLLVRFGQAEWSYAEMVHPADAGATEIAVVGPGRGLLRVRHHLFPEPLEKGVLLRARVRGLVLPRPEDERLAAEGYRAFAASAHPLDT